MHTIWKRQLTPVAMTTTLEMPALAKVVHVAEQHGYPTIWYDVPDYNAPKTLRTFHVIETGGYARGEYRGTVLLHGGAYVLHVYEE